ncbi:hypothetical protein [Streptosporangium sp. NPDC051022]|uniref:hypothetical protein n=1 Tax=Streptosporangium sp. NPDC051022 TaxID=3155752 RepID=UPI00341FD489
MRKIIRMLAVIASASAALAVPLTAGSAHADPVVPLADPSSPAPAAVSAPLTVEDVLRLNPAAKPAGPNRVEIADGLFLLLPVKPGSDAVGASLAASCAYKNLCAWEHSDMTGYGLAWEKCGEYNLGGARYPDGAWVGTGASGPKWNDRLSSEINNQTPGRRAEFYNWEGHWQQVFWTYAYDRRANFAIDKRMDNGGQLNDIIDMVKPC